MHSRELISPSPATSDLRRNPISTSVSPLDSSLRRERRRIQPQREKHDVSHVASLKKERLITLIKKKNIFIKLCKTVYSLLHYITEK